MNAEAERSTGIGTDPEGVGALGELEQRRRAGTAAMLSIIVIIAVAAALLLTS